MKYSTALKQTAKRMVTSWEGIPDVLYELKVYLPNVLLLILQLFIYLIGPLLVVLSPLWAFAWKAEAERHERAEANADLDI